MNWPDHLLPLSKESTLSDVIDAINADRARARVTRTSPSLLSDDVLGFTDDGLPLLTEDYERRSEQAAAAALNCE